LKRCNCSACGDACHSHGYKKADEMKGEKYASQYRPLRAGAIYFMAKRKRQCHERATKISPENQSWHWHRTEGN
jgi:hypothetical protein